ncbi:uncharacterized protein LOC120010356 isoform X1 [Tripterygium wilfordii]|uniref:uncharacterized protein LOC120010356 isoform X1 n=2 Tax=Tripterygium wilfordii TaxID=458696 RepID=UPI0018F80FB1|nr:uncharacterized protein LOC120010356 isoform X1 [Tripterygium wilfordii]
MQASDGGVMVFQRQINKTQSLMSWISCIPTLHLLFSKHTHIHSLLTLFKCTQSNATYPHNAELGLEAIPIMPNKPLSSSSSSSSDILTSTSMLYSSSFSSTMIGEYIGMESCIDLNIDIEGDQVIRDQRHHEGRRKREGDRRCMMKRKEFPPPITSLARTENQPSSHMPWVLKRYYTNDGRLILREEKVKHHEYFKAHRSNGRLTLQLIHLDDDEDDLICNGNGNGNDHCINVNEENKGNDDDENDDFATNQFDLVQLVSDNVNGNENENENDGDQKETDVVKLASPPSVHESSSSSSPIGSGNGKCLIYNNVRKISPCLILEVPAIRPVH